MNLEASTHVSVNTWDRCIHSENIGLNGSEDGPCYGGSIISPI